MKHYVTIQRTQKITYEVKAIDKRCAKEDALHLAQNDDVIPYDVSDAEYEIIGCFTNREVLDYKRKEKNN